MTILRNVSSDGGTLLVVERIVGPPNEGPEAKLSDLNMLVGPGGQERTLEEFESSFEAAGYELVGATPTASGMLVIEGRRPASAPRRAVGFSSMAGVLIQYCPV